MKNFLLLLALVLAFNISTEAQNLLTNSGFETWANVNQPTGWSIGGNSVNFQKNTTQFNEGSASCLINATATATLTQIVPVTAGKTYSFQMSYYYHTTTGNGVRISCYFRNSANKAIKMNVDDSLGLKGPGGNTAYFPKTVAAWKTYTYDAVAPTGATSFVFYVYVASTSSISLDNFGFTENTTPTIYPSKASLTGFTYVPGSGPSVEQTFNIRASNLSGVLTITPPTNYEISLSSGTSFVAVKPAITFASINGIVPSTAIYVRLKSGLAIGNYLENIKFAATGATNQYVLLTGSVAVPPVTITPSVTTLTGFTYAEGNGPSSEKTFTVSGTSLSAGIVVTAPTGYEISLVSGQYSGTTTFTIPQSGGSISTTNLYLRLKSGLTTGAYNGSLTLATTGGTTKTVSLTGNVTVAPGLTVSTTSLSGFSYGLNAGPSTIQSFNVSGTALSTYIIVIPPAGFEISTTTGSLFTPASYLVLPQAGTLSTLYVRLQAGLSISTYSGDISLTSGSFSKIVSLSGNVLIISGVENISNTNTKIYSTGNEIIIEDAAINEMVSIYNLIGMQLKSVQSKGDRISISVTKGSVYLVRAGNKIAKVIM
jgi:hypothetical protein